jgi:hypothetical protein
VVLPRCSAADNPKKTQAHQMSTLLLVLVTLCMTSFTCVGLVAQFGPPSDLGGAGSYYAIPVLLALLLWLVGDDLSAS